MRVIYSRPVLLLSGILTLLWASASHAQLNTVFNNVFREILDHRLSLSPGVHGEHFLEQADLASGLLAPALNGLIASNVAAFPISSATVATLTFNLDSGRPASSTASLGPILAETAETLGKNKVNLEFSYTYFNLAKFRGVSTEDIRFTFTHEDVTGDGTLGESPNESDTIDLFPGFDVDAGVMAFVATWGVANNLDLGIAVPIINVRMRGNTRSIVNSFTFQNLGAANHHFGADATNPVLQTSVPYDESAAGLGDIALRLKYNWLKGGNMYWATLFEMRLPTGNEKDFLGAGKANLKFYSIVSKRIGHFTPHLNLAFDRRNANFDSDEFEFTAGFDQRIVSGVNFALEISGDFDLNERETIKLFPGSVKIVDRLATGTRERNLSLSNIPERNHDNTLNAALGLRVAASERLLFLGNVLVPINDAGLRSTFVSTIGLTTSF